MRLLLSCIARPVKQHLKPCVLAVCCMCSGMHVQTHLKAASLEFAVAKSSINKGIAWCYPAGLGGRLQPVPIAHIRVRTGAVAGCRCRPAGHAHAGFPAAAPGKHRTWLSASK